MFRFLILTKDRNRWINCFKNKTYFTVKHVSSYFAEFSNESICFVIITSINQLRGMRADGIFIDYEAFPETQISEFKGIVDPVVRYGFIAPISVLEDKFYGKI